MQLYVHARACFKKNSSLHIWPKNFSTTFFRILPQNCTFYFSKILMTFFNHRPFLPFSTLPCFTDDDSYFLLFAHYTHLDPLYTHPHAVFHVSTPCFVLS